MRKSDRQNLKILQDRVRQLDGQIDSLQKERERSAEEIGKLITPFPLGSRVSWTHGRAKRFGIVREIVTDTTMKRPIRLEVSAIRVQPHLASGKLSPKMVYLSMRWIRDVKLAPILEDDKS